MAAHAYSLRSRLSGQPSSVRTTPTTSPTLRSGARSPKKSHHSNISLQLKKVVGSTTNGANGLDCCAGTNTYTYCAGAVAVLAKLEEDGSVSQRYFKARPLVYSVNPSTSYYDSQSPANTPTRRRSSIFPNRRGQEETGGGFGREWIDENGSQTWTARERIKSAQCTALSQDGRWLAVGEAGYSPRVLLFSTADDAPSDVPLSIVSDHNFGIRGVAFSPDSRYLATLGNLNDGFLFIWSVNPKSGALKLHSANKCTTSINDLKWCGNSLISVGTRHIKVWQIPESTRPSPSKRSRLRPEGDQVASPGPSTLHGRNCLLGSLVDSTFTSVAVIRDGLAVVGTETGYLCFLEISQKSIDLKPVKNTGIAISSIGFRPSTGQLVIGGEHGLKYESLIELRQSCYISTTTDPFKSSSPTKKPRLSSIRRSLGILQPETSSVVAVGCLSNHTITLDNDGNIQLAKADEAPDTEAQPVFASHNDIVQGVNVLPGEASLGAFFTWSRNGEVKFWDANGNLLTQQRISVDRADSGEDNCENELKTIRYISKLGHFITGDRFGVLKVIDHKAWHILHIIRAHSAEVSDIAFNDETSLLATCGRDRMIQVFQADSTNLGLLQTLDDHIGAVNQVQFTAGAEKLLSCSADRTIVVRDRVQREVGVDVVSAYLTARVITLKATPLSMTPAINDANILITSSMDRHVVRVDISTGAVIESFKLTDPENDDSVTLGSIKLCRKIDSSDDSGGLLVGYSPIDKSIRVYDMDKRLLMARESGHTEGVSDIALLENNASEVGSHKTLVSTGLDGTIMIWSIITTTPPVLTPALELSQSQLLGTESESSPVKASPVSLPPLRKVLTKFDIAEFTKTASPTSPSSPRSLSPPRLQRRTSRLALSATINEDEVMPSSLPTQTIETAPITERGRLISQQSPSPPSSTQLRRIRKQRSVTELGRMNESRLSRSPSPPGLGISTPTSSKNRPAANNSRLRRPPSVPADLRSYVSAQTRKPSVNQNNDFGSMGMATDQACRMLKTYRKKLAASKDDLGLDDLEHELDAIMKLVREKKNQTVSQGSLETGQIKSRKENDVDELVVLLDRTNMNEKPSRISTTLKA